MKAWLTPRNVRDGLIFTVGIGGIIYETVGSQVDRPTLLLLFAAMIGLPAFLRADDREREDRSGGGDK